MTVAVVTAAPRAGKSCPPARGGGRLRPACSGRCPSPLASGFSSSSGGPWTAPQGTLLVCVCALPLGSSSTMARFLPNVMTYGPGAWGLRSHSSRGAWAGLRVLLPGQGSTRAPAEPAEAQEAQTAFSRLAGPCFRRPCPGAGAWKGRAVLPDKAAGPYQIPRPAE